MLCEFVIPQRPVSVQSRRRDRLHEWVEYVRTRATSVWSDEPSSQQGIRLTLVYLFDEVPLDVDNIIKPIQDAIVGIIVEDDAQITDVSSHRRCLKGIFDLSRLPTNLIGALGLSSECVYVRVSNSAALEDLL
jgi:crossover junction endodeoxyribonuclease RusA